MKYTTKIIIAAISAFMTFTGTVVGESTSPRIAKSGAPEYSEYAIAKGLQGTVIIEAVIDEHGHIVGADVVQSVHENLDESALNAVKQWIFEPATVDGVAVKKVVQIPVRFNLLAEQEKCLVDADSVLASRN